MKHYTLAETIASLCDEIREKPDNEYLEECLTNLEGDIPHIDQVISEKSGNLSILMEAYLEGPIEQGNSTWLIEALPTFTRIELVFFRPVKVMPYERETYSNLDYERFPSEFNEVANEIEWALKQTHIPELMEEATKEYLTSVHLARQIEGLKAENKRLNAEIWDKALAQF